MVCIIHAHVLGLKFIPYLFVRLEDIASERVVWHLTSDVAEDFHVLGVMRHVEDPGERREERGGREILMKLAG